MSYFSTHIPFISFSYLITLANVVNAILSSIDDSGDFFCFVSNFRRKLSIFPHLIYCWQDDCKEGFLSLWYNHFLQNLSWVNDKFCQRPFLHLFRWTSNVCLCFFLCDALHLLFFVCIRNLPCNTSEGYLFIIYDIFNDLF